MPDDLDPLERSLLDRIGALTPSDGVRDGALAPLVAAEIFEAAATSRILDHTARRLRRTRGIGYYTIGSAGHESNAAVALALRPTDPALLHYRSGGFYFARASQVPGQDPVCDVLRGMLARSTEPIAGGRHKVWGSVALHVVPQTSTIASHLPRAVGLARSIALAAELPDVRTRWADDAVVVCSFGDASLNHSTAQGALNWACHAAHRGDRVPVLFVCEDNGLGISVPSPDGWVATATAAHTGLARREVDGQDPAAVHQATSELAADVRASGRPALLHLHTVRYLGHAGTDVETAYRTAAELRKDEERDPIIGAARAVVSSGECTGGELVDWYIQQRAAIEERALELCAEPELRTPAEIVAPLAPRRPDQVAIRAASLGTGLAAPAEPRTLAQSINAALRSILDRTPGAIVFGEDVGAKGGVYGVTRGLQRDFGASRVFDTLLDEQSILGLALGAGLDGLLPIPEIQYLAYLHNAEDQLRGEAASLSFFSQGRFRNPMVVRIAGYGYQRGFGGHFHNDNAVGVLRDIPGLVIASPSHPADAGRMLLTCAAAAETDGSVCVFLEPIARYHTADLHADGDGGWLDAGGESGPIAIGSAAVHGDGADGTILTWGNGTYLSRRVQRRLADERGEHWRVVDLRWLAPLPVDDIVREATATGRVVIVDETRRTGGAGEGVLAALVEGGYRGALTRVAAVDSFVPLGPAAELVLVSEDDILTATRAT